MINFLLQLRQQVTIWRFGRQADEINLWFPGRNVLVPIKRGLTEQIMEESDPALWRRSLPMRTFG